MFIKEISKTDEKITLIGYLDKEEDIFLRDSSTLERIKCIFNEEISECKLKVTGLIKDNCLNVESYDILKEPYITYEIQKEYYLRHFLRNIINEFLLENGYYKILGFPKNYNEDNGIFYFKLDKSIDIVLEIERLFKFILIKILQKKLCFVNRERMLQLVNANYLIKTNDKIIKFIESEIECGNVIVTDKKQETILPNGVLLLNKISDNYSNILINYLIKEFGEKPFFVKKGSKIEMFVPLIGKFLEVNKQEFNISVDKLLKII